MMHNEVMSTMEKSVRQTVSLPGRLARHVRHLAKARKTSANRVLLDLIESGLAAKESEKQRFFALAARLTETSDPAEQQRLKEELAAMTFGR
jgi:hypothetical protein